MFQLPERYSLVFVLKSSFTLIMNSEDYMIFHDDPRLSVITSSLLAHVLCAYKLDEKILMDIRVTSLSVTE